MRTNSSHTPLEPKVQVGGNHEVWMLFGKVRRLRGDTISIRNSIGHVGRRARAGYGNLRGVMQGMVTSMSGGAIGDTLTCTQNDGSTATYTMVQVASGTSSYTAFIRTS